MELGFGSSLLLRFQAGRCPEIDNVVTAALLPHQPDELRRRHSDTVGRAGNDFLQ